MARFDLLGMLNRAHQWFSLEGPYSPQKVVAVLVSVAR